MTRAEREALLGQYEKDLDADEGALNLIVEQARREGIARAVSIFRTAEGLDSDVVDDIVAAAYEPIE
jgi:hypothetical protein